MKRLFVDIPKLLKEESIECIDCEYLYHEGANRGVFSIIEIAEFGAYCRQCKESFCIEACPKDALEHSENNTIIRHNMRCVGCKSCILACPFGTIFPEVINYISQKCDFCLNQLENDPDYVPLCVKTAPNETLTMVDIDEDDPENNIYLVGSRMAVKTHHWRNKVGKTK